jgi:hypothetical protein
MESLAKRRSTHVRALASNLHLDSKKHMSPHSNKTEQCNSDRKCFLFSENKITEKRGGIQEG